MLGFVFLTTNQAYTQTSNQTFASGSYIINMGVTPQTFSNGLRPYGFVYELLNTYKIPVAWVINETKTKDGIDFTHNGVDYKGGAFIIPAEFRTPAVNNAIATWQGRGVIGATTVSSVTLPVYKTLRFAPRWTLDKDKGSIALFYFTNASIPPGAYGGPSSSSWKTPAQLAACDDIFVLPHADPTWANHNNLYYWNLNYKGNIWSACHAVSVLENISNAGAGVRMNFLTTNGLLLDNQHGDGSPPYTYVHNTEPVMQFMGRMDDAVVNGSEQIYLPRPGSAWRPGVKVGVYDPTQADVPSKSPGQAAVVAFGRAYDDVNRGFVMYEGGHDHNKSGTIEYKVAAQRAFFNFAYFANNEKHAWYTINLSGLPSTIAPGNPVTLTLETPPEMNLNEYTIQWSTTASGASFSPNTNASTVTFTPSSTTTEETIVVSVTVSDLCNRQTFSSASSLVSQLLTTNDIRLKGKSGKAPELTWLHTTNSEVLRYEVERSTDRINFKPVSVLHTPNSSQYNFVDNQVTHPTHYYRVKAHTVSGAAFYSNTIQVRAAGAEKEQLLVVYPNPIRKNAPIQVQYRSVGVDLLTVAIFDMNGKQVKQVNKAVVTGMNSFSISSAELSAGTYLIHTKAGNGQESLSQRLVIVP
ncbi:T9SS type A sorting domain-containing protein [Flavihumibacter sp. CACIAM 22H1]|uniref:T9SS type A sorting domain-containing protein n=1 Tax=Flavihumibacter sp. CACIAM 22H1 TaxID=1812911 RepID=UPI000A770EE3|nr:T9SS type A sorting domain-containing protein [Flavihumibacter sp. CACIAM 22H1]